MNVHLSKGMACVSVLLLIAMPGPARATSELRDKLAEVAAKVLENTKDRPVSIGQFSPTGLPDSNSGPGIEAALKAKLEKRKTGSVRSDAPFEIKGDYAFAKSRKTEGLKVIKINVRIIGKEFAEELNQLQLSAELDGTNTIAQLLQATAALPAEGTKAERNKELAKKLESPKVFIHGSNKTLISSSKASPYEVEILAKPLADHSTQAAKARGATAEKDGKRGLAFVEIQRDELYEVKVYNNSDREAAVAVSIDEPDMFHFSKDRKENGQPQFSHFILQPRSTETIVGWHNSLSGKENFLSFLVTEYGKGASSQSASAARGHVQFSHCQPMKEGVKGTRSGNETGFGPPREKAGKAVRYEIEPPHDFVSVRYTR